MEGVELAQLARPAAAENPSRTVADMSRMPDSALRRTRQVRIRQAKVATAVYTLVRVAANIWASGFTFDGLARPLVTGLGAYWFLNNENHDWDKSRMQVWAWRLILLLAFPGCDQSVVACLRSVVDVVKLMSLWEILCLITQMHVTSLKLQALGWRLSSSCLSRSLPVGFGISAAATLRADDFAHRFCLVLFLVVLLWQCCCLLCVAGRACMMSPRDKNIRGAASALLVSSLLIVAGPALSFVAISSLSQSENLGRITPLKFELTIFGSKIFQVLSALVLSGMLVKHTRENAERAFATLADLYGFSLTSTSSPITFRGGIDEDASDCIVSFPGRYGMKRLVFTASIVFTNIGMQEYRNTCFTMAISFKIIKKAQQ